MIVIAIISARTGHRGGPSIAALVVVDHRDPRDTVVQRARIRRNASPVEWSVHPEDPLATDERQRVRHCCYGSAASTIRAGRGWPPS